MMSQEEEEKIMNYFRRLGKCVCCGAVAGTRHRLWLGGVYVGLRSWRIILPALFGGQ